MIENPTAENQIRHCVYVGKAEKRRSNGGYLGAVRRMILTGRTSLVSGCSYGWPINEDYTDYIEEELA